MNVMLILDFFSVSFLPVRESKTFFVMVCKWKLLAANRVYWNCELRLKARGPNKQGQFLTLPKHFKENHSF